MRAKSGAISEAGVFDSASSACRQKRGSSRTRARADASRSARGRSSRTRRNTVALPAMFGPVERIALGALRGLELEKLPLDLARKELRVEMVVGGGPGAVLLKLSSVRRLKSIQSRSRSGDRFSSSRSRSWRPASVARLGKTSKYFST
jgi:hypothetical protein